MLRIFSGDASCAYRAAVIHFGGSSKRTNSG
jgi:hypothetical protein